jgi:hypothetical protein
MQCLTSNQALRPPSLKACGPPYRLQAWNITVLGPAQPYPPPSPPATPEPPAAPLSYSPSVLFGALQLYPINANGSICLDSNGGGTGAPVSTRGCFGSLAQPFYSSSKGVSSQRWLSVDAGGGSMFLKEQASGASRQVADKDICNTRYSLHMQQSTYRPTIS